jgi:hypothetical protein
MEVSHQTARCGPRLPGRSPTCSGKGIRSHLRAPQKRASTAVAALPVELFSGDATAAAAHLLHHLPLAYEPVAAPCSLMNCGDVIYRR